MALAIDVRDETVESYEDIFTEAMGLVGKGVPTDAIERVIVTEAQYESLEGDDALTEALEADDGLNGTTAMSYQIKAV